MIRRLVHSMGGVRSSSSRFGGLLEALQVEIKDEIKDATNPHHSNIYQISVGDKVGDFTLEYQWNQFEPSVDRDVFLRRKWARSSSLDAAKVEEEVAVSAVLGPFVRVKHSCDFVPGNVFMKVGVKKTGADPVMLFDCEVMDGDGEPSSFVVRRVSLMPSPIITPHNGFPLGTRRQLQRKDDGDLQLRFTDYLIERGIDTRLTDFLLHHLREKEEEQYAAWLGAYKQTLEIMF